MAWNGVERRKGLPCASQMRECMDELVSVVRDEINPKIAELHARVDGIGAQLEAVNEKIDKHHNSLEKLIIALRLGFSLDPENLETVRSVANRNYSAKIISSAVKTVGLTAIGVLVTGAVITVVKFLVAHPELLP